MLLALLAGCGAPGNDTNSLRFTDIQCIPNTPNGTRIIEGQTLSCIFHVEGVSSSGTILRCEDANGAALDCSDTSSMQIQPFGTNDLPIDDGLFIMSTSGLGGVNRTVVWVADDGALQARHRFDITIDVDDGVNEPPSIELECGGNTDGTASIAAGQQLACTLRFLDPNPDTLSWSYTVAGAALPINEPMPFGGSGSAPYEVTWRWDTDASEAGTTWTFTFTVNDGTAPPVTRNLVVMVQ